MNKKSKLKNPYYLTVLTILTGFVLVFLLYTIIKYEKSIEEDMFKISTSDLFTISQNNALYIKEILKDSDNYIEDIKTKKQLQEDLEKILKNLITENIQYSYLLYKDKNDVFRFLVDASPLHEKAMLNQKFDVASIKWFELYKTKVPVIVKHTLLQELSISYLVPILRQNNVELILVVDFSIHKVEKINKILDMIKNGLYLILIIIVIFFIVFITQIIRYKNMRKSSFTDKLTNLYNRNYLQEIQDEINLDEYIIAALDIDYFKNINDTYGHDVGDMILKEIGNILLHTIRLDEDIVVRYGGEEFLIFIKTKPQNTQISLNVIERIFENIKVHKMYINDEDYINITVSIGINIAPNQSKNFLEAFKFADLALYEAKNSGRDSIKIYGE